MLKKTDLQTMENALCALLGLTRRPVGVRRLQTAADYEASKAVEPKGGLPYCTAVAKAGAKGRSYKLDSRHNCCGSSSVAFGMLPITEERASGKLHAGFKVYQNQDISRQVMDDMVYCEGESYGVEVCPLAECNAEPEVVLIIAPAKAIMRLVQGYAYRLGQLKDIKMAGMCAICQECTSYPIVRGHANVSLLCSGTRCVGCWQENELAMGIPSNQLASVIYGVWHTVDPMEPEAAKRQIAERLQKRSLPAPSINYKKNYYTDVYGAPKSDK